MHCCWLTARAIRPMTSSTSGSNAMTRPFSVSFRKVSLVARNERSVRQAAVDRHANLQETSSPTKPEAAAASAWQAASCGNGPIENRPFCLEEPVGAAQGRSVPNGQVQGAGKTFGVVPQHV